MYVICSEVRFVEFSSLNECDKILKTPNEQTEPTDYMANCSTDSERLTGQITDQIKMNQIRSAMIT